MTEPNQTPTLAERQDCPHGPLLRGGCEYCAAEEIKRLTAALSAAESEKETYRARWLSCVTPEEAERLRAALSIAERERDVANGMIDRLVATIQELRRDQDRGMGAGVIQP